MYTSLKLKHCKHFCAKAFETFNQHLDLPYAFSTREFYELLHLCLDYNYIEFNKQHFNQVHGIQMGNSASVTIANITAFYELKDLFDLPEIIFNVRFVDDGFLIVDSTYISNINEWCEKVFTHPYLTFTTKTNEKSIEFLDVVVNLTEQNKIYTTLYSKPMARNVFLHYESNHPKSLTESLPYCQAIRIKRICSDVLHTEIEIDLLLKKFACRGYPDELLQNCKNKVKAINRVDILKPKTNLVIKHLKENNPKVLERYEIQLAKQPNVTHNPEKVYIVMPFYKNMFNFKNFVIHYIHAEAEKGQNEILKNIVTSLNLVMSYKKVNCLERYCKNRKVE